MKSARLTPEQVRGVADVLGLNDEKWADVFGEIAVIVDRSNAAYGDAFGASARFLELLWPQGVEPCHYANVLAVIRIFDKLMRIAHCRDAFGESPARDVAGYGGLLYALHIDADSVEER